MGTSSSAAPERAWVRAYIALGSNLGDRETILRGAIDRLRAMPGVTVVAVSRWAETTPVEMDRADAPAFLNGVVGLDTVLPPADLLDRLRAIERDFGRVREPCQRLPAGSASRTLDLDLLLYGDQILAGPELTVPHPRMHQRAFVLGPLVEIAPDVVHPVLGRTVGELWAGLSHLVVR